MNKLLFSLLLLLLLPVATVIVITPMDSDKQYIFGLFSIGLILLLGVSKSHLISVIMVVMSFFMFTPYYFLRCNRKPAFYLVNESGIGICLIIAQTVAWNYLVIGYLQTT